MTYLDPAKIAELVSQHRYNLHPDTMKPLLDEIAAAIAADGAAIPQLTAGSKAMAILRVASAVTDGETVTIGGDVYEVDTRNEAHVAPEHIRLDLHAGSTVKAQGTLTIANNPSAGDTMTIGDVVYTFVPDGTANHEGEVEIGTDLATAEAAIKAAINGTDGYNTPNPYVTCGDFVAHVGTLTAIVGGTAGVVATTETFTPVGNVFDGETLGTKTAAVDPTAAEFTTALAAAINASGTEPVTAVRIGANEVLVFKDTIGVDTTALAETLAGANNAWDTNALRAGSVAAELSVAKVSRVPNAQEVALGNLHIPLPFKPTIVFVQVRVTADGSVKAWDGGFTINGTTNPYITLTNAGNTDWAATDTVSVLAIG